jgi:hypothetical protein
MEAKVTDDRAEAAVRADELHRRITQKLDGQIMELLLMSKESAEVMRLTETIGTQSKLDADYWAYMELIMGGGAVALRDLLQAEINQLHALARAPRR